MQGRLVHPFVTRCIDGVAQVLEVQVGVDLRGGDVGVVHELLHVAQGHAGGDHVVAEGVTQVVSAGILDAGTHERRLPCLGVFLSDGFVAIR